MSHNSTRWSVEGYHHALRLDGPARERQSPTPPERTSGDISSFSSGSRRRLIKKILRLESSRLTPGAFVTLTYHEQWTTEREDLQSDLNAFLQALRREYPEAVYIWRLEFQTRGAPHFHLMIWRSRGSGEIPLGELAQWVRKTWTRIADQGTEAHEKWGTDTARISSWREAMGYVSKYVAANGKEGEVEYSGRRWGASQSLPTSSTLRFHISESDAHLLRRILRKFIGKKLGKEHPLHDHLKHGRKALIGLEPETWQKLIDYLQEYGDGSIRDGPVPDPPSDVPEGLGRRAADRANRKEWEHYQTETTPSNVPVPSGGTKSGPSALHRSGPDVLIHRWE